MQVGGLSIQHIQADDHLQIKLSGELDLAAADALRSELLQSENELETGEVEEVIVDTTHLDFIDSSGLGALAEARNRLGEQLILVPGRITRRILDISGTAQHFGLD